MKLRHFYINIATTLLLCATLVNAYAQITKVDALLKKGAILEAKNYVDSLADVKSKQSDASMWFSKGMVYEQLYAQKDTAYNKARVGYLLDAGESYLQALQATENPLAKPKAEERLKKHIMLTIKRTADSLATLKITNQTLLLLDLYARYYNTDTTAWLALAMFADKAEENYTAISAYEKLMALKGKNKNYIKSLVLLNIAISEFNQALKYASIGKKQFANDLDFHVWEAEILIQTKKMKEAMAKLDTLILADHARKTDYLFTQATLWQQADSVQKAINTYEKVLQLNPNHLHALYNLGGIYLQKAYKFYDEINQSDFYAFQKNGKKLKIQADEWAEKALPYFEKCYRMGMKADTKEILSALYKNMGLKDKTQ